MRIPITPPFKSLLACVEDRYMPWGTRVGHCEINQTGILIADTIPGIDYLLEQINVTARTWYIAIIDPENTSSFYHKQRIPKPFLFHLAEMTIHFHCLTQDYRRSMPLCHV